MSFLPCQSCTFFICLIDLVILAKIPRKIRGYGMLNDASNEILSKVTQLVITVLLAI